MRVEPWLIEAGWSRIRKAKAPPGRCGNTAPLATFETSMDPARTTSVPARTVLVVEDDPLVRSVAVMHLQTCDLSVVEAATGEEAVALIRNDPSVAAVFSDIQMPGSIDGIGLAQWLARERPTVKVLLTSGRMGLTSGRMGSEGLDWPFVAKTYRLDELEHEVRSLLDSSLP